MVRTCSALAAVFVSFAALSITASAQAQTPAYVAAAVDDAGRPAADKEADAIRQPADTVAFSTMKPGDVVAEFLPGRGYYTRILSNVVGAEGKVYAIVPQENLERRATAADGVNAIAAEADHANVEVTSPSMASLETPEPVDMVWTSDNYHDVRNGRDADTMLSLNQAIFNSLKPGGVYFIVDHVAADGTSVEDKRANHRMDRETLVSDVTQAGFILDGESDALMRPEDELSTHSSFASSQLVLRFRKPE